MIVMISQKWKKRLLILVTVLFAHCVVSLVATKFICDGIFRRYEGTVTVPAELTEMVAQRQSHTFPSGENDLAGYLYESSAPGDLSALIILAPGFHAGADDYLWQIRELTDRGWAVFAYDATGSCHSEGESTVGFPQSTLDLEAALKYVEKCQNFGYNKIVLLGHSQGGYAVGCALDGSRPIAAAVTVSGVNSAMEGVMGNARSYVGPLAYGNYGFLWLYQAFRFGPRRVGLDAAKTISQSSTPVLVIHGYDDPQVPADRDSIFSHRERVSSADASFLLWEEPGSQGHTDLLFDPDGTANNELMDTIHSFLLEKIK